MLRLLWSVCLDVECESLSVIILILILILIYYNYNYYYNYYNYYYYYYYYYFFLFPSHFLDTVCSFVRLGIVSFTEEEIKSLSSEIQQKCKLK
jgi:hypothetical protein